MTVADLEGPPTAGIGIDIGGTKLAGTLLDPTGSVVARVRQATPHGDGDQVVDAIVRAGAELLATARSGGLRVGPVAVALPGTIDRHRGTVVDAPVLGLRDVPLVALGQRALAHPVMALHDVKAAAFGELVAGAAGPMDFAYLNLGTGVSMAWVFGGRVHEGDSGTAGEIGHVVAVEGGLACSCGRRGCLETVASGPAIERAASAGDDHGARTLGDAGDHLGRVLADFLMVLDVGTLVVGGGVSSVGAALLDPLQEALDRELSDVVPSVEVVPAALGADSGVVGAAHRSRLAACAP